jgi:hypothetical protein
MLQTGCVVALFRIQWVSVSVTEGFRGFPQSVRVNSATLYQNRSRSVPSTPAIVHSPIYSSTL